MCKSLPPEPTRVKKNGGRKISLEKRRKQQWMWLEQVYYKIDKLEARIKALEKEVFK